MVSGPVFVLDVSGDEPVRAPSTEVWSAVVGGGDEGATRVAWAEASRRYPRELLRREVQAILLAKQIEVEGRASTGFADRDRGMIAVVAGGRPLEESVRSVHHELAHLLVEDGGPIGRVLPAYARVDGGWEDLPIGASWSLGFVTRYASTNPWEDAAELATMLMTDPEQLAFLAGRYPRIGAKTDLLLEHYCGLGVDVGPVFDCPPEAGSWTTRDEALGATLGVPVEVLVSTHRLGECDGRTGALDRDSQEVVDEVTSALGRYPAGWVAAHARRIVIGPGSFDEATVCEDPVLVVDRDVEVHYQLARSAACDAALVERWLLVDPLAQCLESGNRDSYGDPELRGHGYLNARAGWDPAYDLATHVDGLFASPRRLARYAELQPAIAAKRRFLLDWYCGAGIGVWGCP